MKTILALFLIGILLFGCTDAPPKEYACDDGTKVTDIALCEELKSTPTPTKIATPIPTDDMPPLPPG